MEVLYLKASQYLFIQQQQRGTTQTPQIEEVSFLSPNPNQSNRGEDKCRLWNEDLAEVADRQKEIEASGPIKHGLAFEYRLRDQEKKTYRYADACRRQVYPPASAI